MNKSILTGNLVRDIDVAISKTGTVIGKFTLAVARPMKKGETDFINCIAFGKTAETMSNYLGKGSKVLVEGRIQTGSYDAKDGTKRYTTDVVVEKFEFLDKASKKVDEPFDSGNIEMDGDMPF